MDIKAYLANEPRGAAADLARAVGVHPVTVSQWANGIKAVSAERCVPIERATAGAVRRWDLRPDDWHRIWPELIGTDGAPAIPETIAAQED